VNGADNQMGAPLARTGNLKMSTSSSVSISYNFGQSDKKGSFMSGTNYASARPTRSNGANMSMSIGGQSAGASFNKRCTYQPSMVVGLNASKTNVSGLPNVRRN